MKKKTIGILGGMGPEATVYLFNLIIKATAAAKDQDHARILVWNDPTVPPRTDAIFGLGPSPLPRLLAGAKVLQRGGADLIVMPCLTAHYYAGRIAARSKLPLVNLIDESLREAKRRIPGLRKAGLLASSGTVQSGLFHKHYARGGIEVMAPEPDEQRAVMDAIIGRQGIKAGFTTGRPRAVIVRAARRLVKRGAEAVIAGCTEVPLVLRPSDLDVPLIEPMGIAAAACLKKAGYKIKGENRNVEKIYRGRRLPARPDRPRPGRAPRLQGQKRTGR